MSTQEKAQMYGIGAVAKLTGLTDHTIRVWERRHQAVIARRAPNGRRLYRATDVEKLGLLKALTDRGLSISSIAGETIRQLRKRADAMIEIAAAPSPSNIDTAILGDLLPQAIRNYSHSLSPLNIVAADNDSQSLAAGLAQQVVDILVIEQSILSDQTIEELRRLRDICGAQRCVLIFSYGKSADIERLRESEVTLLRSPVTVEEVVAAVTRAYNIAGKPRGPRRTIRHARDNNPLWSVQKPIAPHRFTQQQLVTLTTVSTTIDCECPRHLAQMAGDLSAFEAYSANCANSNADDAALHEYLHVTTAQARALIESALERVAQAEGLQY
jgi:DNA-binding transcriptional MerR regulator